MNVRNPYTFFTSVSVIALVALMPLGAFAASGTATRTLPAGYTAGATLQVSISAAPQSGGIVQTFEEIPPQGWVVSAISDGGSYDSINKKVKWGPYFDNVARTLKYSVTPPQGTTGTKTFSGLAAFDSSPLITIAGATSISVGGDTTVTPPSVNTLTVSKTGNGTVTSTSGLINCGSQCMSTYVPDAEVTLNATPDQGSVFIGWAGACTGTGQCVITMTANKLLSATFALATEVPPPVVEPTPSVSPTPFPTTVPTPPITSGNPGGNSGENMGGGQGQGRVNIPFTKLLKLGSSGPEVLRLQQFLNDWGFPVRIVGTGSFGHETSYYGKGTADAVKKFQEYYSGEILAPKGLRKGTGSLGPGTMKKMNALIQQTQS